MLTSLRRSRLAGFGLVDTLVGVLLLAAAAAFLSFGFSTLLALGQRQETKTEALIKAMDAHLYGDRL